MSRERSGLQMENFPVEIIVAIFTLLPRVYLPFVCSLVCREWNTIIGEHFLDLRIELFSSKNTLVEYAKYIPTKIIKKFVVKNDILERKSLIEAVCNSGKLNLLIWMDKKNNFLSWRLGRALIVSCKTGNLKIAQFLYGKIISNCVSIGENNLEIFNQSLLKLAKRGHLHILKWVDKKFEIEYFPTMFRSAAWGGNLKTLDWLINKNLELPYDSPNKVHDLTKLNLIEIALECNYNHLLNWLEEKGFKIPKIYKPPPVESPSIFCIEWAIKHRIKFDYSLLFEAVCAKDIKFIEWCANYLPPNLILSDDSGGDSGDGSDMTIITFGDNDPKIVGKKLAKIIFEVSTDFEIIKWANNLCLKESVERNWGRLFLNLLRRKDCPNKKDIIVWLKDNGYQKKYFQKAIICSTQNDYDIVMETLDNLSLLGSDEVYEAIINCNKNTCENLRELIRSAENHGFKMNEKNFNMFFNVFFNDVLSLEDLVWIKKRGNFEWNEQMFEMACARWCGGEDVIELLKNEGCPWNYKCYCLLRERQGKEKALWMLRGRYDIIERDIIEKRKKKKKEKKFRQKAKIRSEFVKSKTRQ